MHSRAVLTDMVILLLAAPSAAFAHSSRLPTVSARAPAAGRSAAASPAAKTTLMALDPAAFLESAQAAAFPLLKLRGGAVGVGGVASVIPPVATLAVALLTKQVAVALLCGIFSGCMLLNDLNPCLAFLRTFDTFIVDAVSDKGHATVILFNLVLGGTIGLVQKGGGALGLAQALKRFAKDAQSCLATSVALASLIFFDDYASILIVGNSFGPLLPMLRVCRAKFAALIHYVAVAVSASMPVSSWIGLQVGQASTATAAIVAAGAVIPDPFMLTMQSLPYRFFPLALLAFVGALVATDLDFGPMADAVDRTNAEYHNAGTQMSTETAEAGGTASSAAQQQADPLAPKPGTPLRAANALIPFGAIVAVTLGGMVLDGKRALIAGGALPDSVSLMTAVGSGDSVLALLWGSTAGMLTCMTLLLGQKVLDLGEVMDTVINGMKDVIEPVIVLSLAWALGSIITAAGTADFISTCLKAGGLPVWGLPFIASVLSYVISFATGSSFGTMGIIFPLIGPLAWDLGQGSLPVLLHCFGAVYGGSLFGNMFSPIADTSILTVLACRINLQEHVTTAAPYACLVGLTCLLLGDLPVGIGLYGPTTALAAIVAVNTGVLSFLGRKPKSSAAPVPSPK